jgi:hypothetical protein
MDDDDERERCDGCGQWFQPADLTTSTGQERVCNGCGTNPPSWRREPAHAQQGP